VSKPKKKVRRKRSKEVSDGRLFYAVADWIYAHGGSALEAGPAGTMNAEFGIGKHTFYVAVRVTGKRPEIIEKVKRRDEVEP